MIDWTGADSRDVEDPGDEYGAEEPEVVELAIKLNEESSEYECAVCGAKRTSAAGPELFLADTWDIVCDACGRDHAPLLAALIDLGGAAEGYAAVRDLTRPTYERQEE